MAIPSLTPALARASQRTLIRHTSREQVRELMRAHRRSASLPLEPSRGSGRHAVRNNSSPAVPSAATPLAPAPTCSNEIKEGQPSEESGDSPCPRTVPFDVIDADTSEVLRQEHRRCMTKGCDACRPVRYRRQLAHYGDVFEGRCGLFHVVLTVDPELGLKPWESRDYLYENCWKDKLTGRLKRRCKHVGEGFLYVGAFEEHESAAAHLHLLVACPIDPAVIREQAFAAGFGASMVIQPVDGDREAVVAKLGYALKHAFDVDRGHLGRVLASHGIGFDSKRAKEQRRAYVAERERRLGNEPVVLQPVVEDRRPSRPRRTKEAKAAQRARFAELDQSRRRFQYLERTLDGRYGIRHAIERSSRRYRVDAVRIEWDGRTVRYVDLARNVGSEAAGWAAIMLDRVAVSMCDA